MSSKESYICSGGTYSIMLQSDQIILRPKSWIMGPTHRIPISEVRTVIVERKSVVPFATMTVLSVAVAIALRYPLFWGQSYLSPGITFSDIAILAVLIFAVATVLRALFVNIIISSVSNNSWRIRLASPESGRRLVAKFHDLSGSQI